MSLSPPPPGPSPHPAEPGSSSGSPKPPNTHGRIHTLVVSDLHLTEAEPDHPKRPLWKRYKRREFFIDQTFSTWLDTMRKKVEDDGGRAEDIELVLAGDIFDFDAVTALPDDRPFPIGWIERRRGLDPQQAKSHFKSTVILGDHPVWLGALRSLVLAGGSVVFIIGNHDLELHWPSVQAEVRHALELPAGYDDAVRFTEWFYVSGDTLIEHGNQYDPYCVANDPIHPYIEKAGVKQLRMPFGNLASRLMLNGMGLFNPHVEGSFLMTFREYVSFFLRYMLTAQPLLVWAWFWSALVTLVRVVGDGLHPSVREPTLYAQRLNGIAQRANSTPAVALALDQLRVHSAVFSPFKILRELWLDRALMTLALMYASFQLILFINAFVPLPLLWTLVPLAVLLPAVFFYSQTVQTDVYDAQRAAFETISIAAQIAGVDRVIHGHTHQALHVPVTSIEHLNPGTWSPAFHDPECTKEVGHKCFVWLQPTPDGGRRQAGLYGWTDPTIELLSGSEKAGDVDPRLKRFTVPPGAPTA